MKIEAGKCYKMADGDTFEVEYIVNGMATGHILTQNSVEATVPCSSLSDLPHWKSGF